MSSFAMTDNLTGLDQIGIDQLLNGTGKFSMKAGRRLLIAASSLLEIYQHYWSLTVDRCPLLIPVTVPNTGPYPFVTD